MALVTAKSSTIFIGTSGGTQVYHSLEEVPESLRVRLRDSTQSPHSATILIADKRGREELVRALQGEPSNVQCRLADSMRSRRTETPRFQDPRVDRRFPRRWFDFLLPVAIGASLWLLVDAHF